MRGRKDSSAARAVLTKSRAHKKPDELSLFRLSTKLPSGISNAGRDRASLPAGQGVGVLIWQLALTARFLHSDSSTEGVTGRGKIRRRRSRPAFPLRPLAYGNREFPEPCWNPIWKAG